MAPDLDDADVDAFGDFWAPIGGNWKRRLHLVLVAIVLAAPLAVFFAPTFGGSAPGAFDLNYQNSPWRDQSHRPIDAQSPAQVDQSEQLPWVDGMWNSLRDGRVPMWTPAVGGGTPLGTNPVFTTYSVFTAVGELFGGAVGLAVRVILAVAVAELFSYLLMRRMGLSIGAAIFGTVTYVFGGSAVMMETRNALPLLLPLALWCTDRLAVKINPRRTVALALAVVALWLEGFPAMLVHVLFVCGTWWFARTLVSAGFDFRRREVWVRWIRAGAAFATSIVLGVMICGVSAIPFGLQLKYNNVFAARADSPAPLPRVAIWWLLDERALGAPDRGPWFMALNPFEGVAAVGTLVMVLAVVGVVVSAMRRRSTLPSHDEQPGRDVVRNHWAIVVAALVTATYLGGPVLGVLYAIPGFGGNPFWRIRFVLAFGLSMLAALGLNELEGLWANRSRKRAGAPAVATLGWSRSERAADAQGGSDVEPTRASWRQRLPHIVVAIGCVGALAAPFALTLGEYRTVLSHVNRPFFWSYWKSEVIVLAIAAVLGMLLLRVTARAPERFTRLRTIGIGAFAAGLAFTQVGLHLTRFTPQVDRSFYYPPTEGYRELRRATNGEFRFIGSGMGTFAPNSAMTSGVIDARSHSFRDPQWKTLILTVFPDATVADPLKINVDFHGNVNWTAPAFDDMAIGVLAMSSGEVPLGDRHPPAAAASWLPVTGGHPLDGAGPVGPFVGLDLQMRTSGDCTDGVVVVTSAVGGTHARARRPLSDVTAIGATGNSTPFAMPMGHVAADAASRLSIGIDGAPASCLLAVGSTDPTPGAISSGAITRPPTADWEMQSADGGWLYSRASAAPLVRMLTAWRSEPTRGEALRDAVAPRRVRSDPTPVLAASPPPEVSAVSATVTSWNADDHGISAAVTSSGDSILATAFNSAPGWTVTVDGGDRHLVEPDGAFLGVQVGPGTHRVRFEYHMPGLRSGLLVTLLGLAGCAAVLLGADRWLRLARRFRLIRRKADPTTDLTPDPRSPAARSGAASPGTPTAAARD